MPPRISRLVRRSLTFAVLACSACVLVGALTIWRAASPPRAPDAGVVSTLGLRVETVAIRATDGVALEGWLLRGPRQAPAVLMGHDFGRSKASLINLARALHESGFTVMLFDFRGHGESAGGGSTFGLAEKRDVLGALEALRSATGSRDTSIGLYGIGMGAHAAALAAADRASLSVLVLDDLYPDAGWPLRRRVWGDWQPGETAERASIGLFAAMYRVSPATDSAAASLATLSDRSLLLLAPSSDPELAARIRTMYESIPLRRDIERNFEVLPAMRGGDRYGADHDRHARTVVEFFRTRLGND